jgi:uncharacterized protein YbjT (DUF2867 family)
VILVLGGTGTVGGAVLRALDAAGVPARAVVRDPARAGTLGGPAAETAVADLADPATLGPALDGVEAVFLVTPASARQVDLENGVVDAAADRGVRVVKLAALGWDEAPADQLIRLALNHARVVEHLRERDVPHTVLAPAGFDTNFLGSAATVRQGQLYASAGDGAVAWIDPDDIGAVAAHVLAGPGHEGASYDLTGPELLTHAQLAGVFGEVLGREVRYVDVPAGQFAGNLRQAGLDDWTAQALDELNQVYRAHGAELVTDEVEKATGRPPRSFRDWLVEHRAAFT